MIESEPEPKKTRKWYQKKRYLVPLVLFTSYALASSGNSAPQTQPSVNTFTPTQQEYKPIVAPPYAPPVQSSPQLSNDNYYTNVSGNTVHSPAYTSDNSVPAGASARCRDGTYSFSQHRQGTCSHHGGVSTWNP